MAKSQLRTSAGVFFAHDRGQRLSWCARLIFVHKNTQPLSDTGHYSAFPSVFFSPSPSNLADRLRLGGLSSPPPTVSVLVHLARRSRPNNLTSICNAPHSQCENCANRRGRDLAIKRGQKSSAEEISELLPGGLTRGES